LASTLAGAAEAAAGAAGAWAKAPAAKKPAINVASNLVIKNTPSFQLSAQHCVELVNTTRCLTGLMTRCQPSCNLLYPAASLPLEWVCFKKRFHVQFFPKKILPA
jgi:hypothetical protein